MAECQLWGESLQVPPTPWGRACEHRPRETSCPQQSHQELLLSSALEQGHHLWGGALGFRSSEQSEIISKHQA